MTPQGQQATGLPAPHLFSRQGEDNEMAVAIAVLKFLAESAGGYDDELPYTRDASWGLALIIDGVIDLLRTMERKQ